MIVLITTLTVPLLFTVTIGPDVCLCVTAVQMLVCRSHMSYCQHRYRPGPGPALAPGEAPPPRPAPAARRTRRSAAWSCNTTAHELTGI